jgi:hypothetical protein
MLTAAALALLFSVAEAKKARGQEAAQQRAESHLFGLKVLGFCVVMLFVPPLFMCLRSLYRDPATKVLARMLWLRAKEVVGFEVGDDAETLLTDLRTNAQAKEAKAARAAQSGNAAAAPGMSAFSAGRAKAS